MQRRTIDKKVRAHTHTHAYNEENREKVNGVNENLEQMECEKDTPHTRKI